MLSTMEFLDVVWGKVEGWVDVPSKIRGHWMPFMAEWPADRPVIGRRIRSCVEDGESVYFSAAMFRNRMRRLEDTLRTEWLWADLDTEDPVFLDEDGVLPTLAWESSPGRYQAMWKLSKPLLPETQTKLNRRLTYAISADHGGYDLTQVLRPPGTKNFKYRPPGDVELLWYLDDVVYVPKDLLAAIVAIEQEEGIEVLTPDAARQKARRAEVNIKSLPARARRLLQTPASMIVEGERSNLLWQLECTLAEAGLEADQIFALVEPTPLNKWKGMRTDDEHLRRDIQRALDHVSKATAKKHKGDRNEGKERARSGSDEEEETGGGASGEGERGDAEKPASPFVQYGNFLGSHIASPRWLIEDIWSSDSHGFIGGEPKVSKSTFALAMALSVATGKKFLGRYKVPSGSVGPVLVVQEENAPWMMQDRLRKLAHNYGLFGEGSRARSPKGSIAKHQIYVEMPKDYELYLLNNYGFDLTDPDDRELLEREVVERGAKLVILDPFYLMMGASNVSAQHEIGPILQWLTALRYTHDCAVALVHHWSKYNENSQHRRPGQRLLGSAIQHGWVESGIYIENEGWNEETGEMTVKVEREFRNSPPRAPINIVWKLGKVGELDMSVEAFEYNQEGKMVEILHGLGISAGNTLSLASVEKEMGVERSQLMSMVREANDLDLIRKPHAGKMIWHVALANGKVKD